MARIDIRSNGGGGGSVATGVLQLQGGVAMTSTLTAVTDQNNTTSPLKLSTTAVQVVSPLRISTDDPSDFYLDCEDGSTNNRFSITRNTSSQQVNLNFASNPAGGTTTVGAIRTYKDGTNLSEVMSFREDGNIGIGTTTPTSKLQVTESFTTTANNYSAITFDGTLTSRATASDTIYGLRNTQSIVSTATGQTIIANDLTPNYTFFDGNTNYVGLKVGGNANTQNLGTAIWCVQKTTAGNNGLAISPYNTRWAIGMTSATSNVITNCDLMVGQSGIGIGISGGNPAARLEIKGSGSTSATTSLLVQNSAAATSLEVTDDQQVKGYSGSQVRFKLGYTTAGQSLSTRDGELGIGYIDANNSAGLRIYANGSGSTFIDGWTEGSSKATNYPLYIGSRANNTGQGVSGITTQENGTQTIFGYAVNEASAQVTINSTTRGFLPPRMTDAQIRAIASPAEGLIAYNTTISVSYTHLTLPTILRV